MYVAKSGVRRALSIRDDVTETIVEADPIHGCCIYLFRYCGFIFSTITASMQLLLLLLLLGDFKMYPR